MGRKYRKQLKDAWYHVFNRGVARRNIFLEDADYCKFLYTMDECAKKFMVETHTYCLMKNHYHLLLFTPQANISEAMHWVLSRYVRYFNTKYCRDGPLFKGRFQSKLVQSEAYLLKLCAYIHSNPVKDKFVTDLKDYHWSSFHAFTGGEIELKTLQIEEILLRFNRLHHELDFETFVLSADDDLDDFYRQTKEGYGLKSFDDQDALNQWYKQKSLYIKQSHMQTVKSSVTFDDVLTFVSNIYDCEVDDILISSPGKHNLARQIAITLVYHHCALLMSEIAEIFGASRSAISKTVNSTQSLKLFIELNNRLTSHVPGT